jgi:hypothetical protein
MLTDYTAEMVSNTIVQSVALGRNPRVLARELTRAYGMGLTQSLNMAARSIVEATERPAARITMPTPELSWGDLASNP